MDNTEIHPNSLSMSHLIGLFLFKGPPKNRDPDRKVQVLVNHGFISGYAPSRLQPLWSAYRVAHADRWVNYDRPHLYYADDRLPEQHRLAPDTFGTHNGVAYNVGHMVPNAAINTQFGRLAQMETFLMSNMSPQYGSLNQGLWLKLENKIRNIEDTPQKDHVWAVAGPIFDEAPHTIPHSGGKSVPVPTDYYYILIDPFRYPWNRESNVDIVCFRVPQDVDRDTPFDDLIVTLEEIEQATMLDFLPGWDHDVAVASEMAASRRTRVRRSTALDAREDAWDRHRFLRQL